MKVHVFLADGFEEIEALAVVDILRRGQIEVETVSIHGRKEVKGAHDITVLADQIFEMADFTDSHMLILPGGQPGTKNLSGHEGLKELLLAFSRDKRWIGAICAAPTVLARHGILQGTSAVCFPGCEEEMTGAKVSFDMGTAVDGNIITSRAAGTAMEFALTIVAQLKGKEVAQGLKEKMLIL